MAQLTVVPTPIGNLGDITLRGLEALREADLILAEDTRTSSVLLRHYEIAKPMESHHKFNEYKTSERLAQRIAEGTSVALISDAGTPGINDPGAMLIRACIDAGVTVTCLPGATAFVPALVASGLDTTRFCYEGFLPVKKGRQTLLTALATETRTVIIYESPYRVCRTLADLITYFGAERQAATCRELSKLHEEVRRGTLQELSEHFAETAPRGEFVIVVAGAKPIKVSKNNSKHITEDTTIQL